MRMKIRIYSLLILIGLLITRSSIAQNINICIFSDIRIQSFSFIVVNGKYDIVSGNKEQVHLNDGDTVIVKRVESNLQVSVNAKKIGIFEFIKIRGTNIDNVFAITPLAPKAKTRVYDEDIYVTVDKGELQIVNDVNFEKYIAGVIESEGGYVAPQEYYKVQSILCRTYAIKNYQRHLSEGYNLCDKVHCQAYKGKCTKNINIVKATNATKGIVVVDSDQIPITATFFSNSGGQTMNSEDTWTTKIPYLRSIKDSFSLGQPNATWERRIPKQAWQNYLLKKGCVLSDSIIDFTFKQASRESLYTICGNKIPLHRIRTDWTLKSTYFNIIPLGDTLLFKGKGFGHGVGLSQEGAIKMATLGYSYDKIIKFYYRNVQLRNMKTFHFFEVE